MTFSGFAAFQYEQSLCNEWYIKHKRYAVTLLVGRQEEHVACKNQVMRCCCGYLSAERCRLFAYDSADATAIPKTPSSLASFKSRLVLPLWNRLTQVVLENRPLNTHTRLTALCPGLPGWAGTRKVKPIWIWLKQETVSGSGISWATCNSAPRTRQITTPAQCFTGRMPFLPPNQQRQSTASQNPIITRFIEIQTGFTSLKPAHPGCPGKEAVDKRV